MDPITINVAPAQRLQAFKLQANGQPVYDISTDTSNPSPWAVHPSSVKLNSAASCGQTYVLNLLAQDTGDPNFLNAGQTDTITYPQARLEIFLPVAAR